MLFDLTAWLPAVLFYLLFIYWIVDANLFSKLGFTTKEVVTIFSVKCAWCIAYAVFHWIFFHGGDTLVIFREAAQVNKALHRDPIDFFILEFLPNHWYIKESLYHYNYALHMYGSESTWLLVRLNSLFYLVSFGSYPAHIVMFSFATLPATLCLLRFMLTHTLINKWWSYVALLIFLGIAFWGNGMHKEAIVISGAGFTFYAFMKARNNGWTLSISLLLLLGLILLLTRSFMPLLLAPAMLAICFYETHVSKRARLITASIIGLVVCLALFRLTRNDFISGILEKQKSFAQLDNSGDNANSIQWSDMPTVLLTGITRGFIFPFGKEFDVRDWPLYLMNLFVLAIPFFTFQQFDTQRFLRIGIWFIVPALFHFIIIGTMISHAGAISRYKAPMLLFLIFGWLCSLKQFNLINLKSK